MHTQHNRSGFSLMEVNMAVFVMAIGVLSMVVLYPLGLRESTQGQADLKQSMFADDVLNQAVAAASQTNITWSEWSSWKGIYHVAGPTIELKSRDSVPGFIRSKLNLSDGYSQLSENTHYKIACCLVPGASDKIMGIMVQSTDLYKTISAYTQLTNNPIYYAEVMFQGDPTR